MTKSQNHNNHHHQHDRREKTYCTLSFEYTFDHEKDTVYFAYSIPYTYSMVLNFAREIALAQKANIM